jgi:hypothetical protein
MITPLHSKRKTSNNKPSIAEYRINNFFDCEGNAAITHSSNITGYYGGAEWTAIYANSAGTGWVQATQTVGGITYTTPKKYITCNP